MSLNQLEQVLKIHARRVHLAGLALRLGQVKARRQGVLAGGLGVFLFQAAGPLGAAHVADPVRVKFQQVRAVITDRLPGVVRWRAGIAGLLTGVEFL